MTHRIASAVALLILSTTLALVAAPAHADRPCDFEVEEMPGLCLTKDQYDYVVGLQHDSESLVHAREDVGQLRTANQILSTKLHDQALTIDPLREQLVDAQLTLERKQLRITVLRAKVKTLWRALRAVRA